MDGRRVVGRGWWVNGEGEVGETAGIRNMKVGNGKSGQGKWMKMG